MSIDRSSINETFKKPFDAALLAVRLRGGRGIAPVAAVKPALYNAGKASRSFSYQQHVGGKMHSHYSVVVSLFFLVGFTGCSTVVSSVQPGKPLSADDAKKLEGIWLTPVEMDDGNPIWVKHIKENELRVAVVVWNESEFRMDQMTVFVTECNGQKYVNWSNPDLKDAPEYHMMRLTVPEEEHALLCGPRFESFETAVNEGQLAGELTKEGAFKTLRLESSAEELGKFLQPAKAAEQFNLDRILVLRRVGKIERDSN